jgi:hypothetical protein
MLIGRDQVRRIEAELRAFDPAASSSRPWAARAR